MCRPFLWGGPNSDKHQFISAHIDYVCEFVFGFVFKRQIVWVQDTIVTITSVTANVGIRCLNDCI